MVTTTYNGLDISPVDALWALIQGQDRSVRFALARRLNEQQSTSEAHIAKAFERLDHLATLKDGWAGKGSYAISPQVVNNVRSVLSVSNDDDWRCWMIGPDVNATLGLQSKQTGGSISVGEKEFSYYVNKEGEEYHDSHVPFKADLLLNIMRKIG